MVNDAGQLYTMEGIAAGIIMLLTAYIVVSTTSIYTAGDTHIPDMQLEQLGNDVLAMMDTPNAEDTESDLKRYINADNATGGSDQFRDMFLEYCNARTSGADDDLKMSANITYREGDVIKERLFVEPPDDGSWTGRESAVRVTRWVQLPPDNPYGDEKRTRTVLVEVLLWRA
ncbi:MAG TPA: hypothetical protein PKK74_01745 [Candidatus Methanoculleus thermohydrogenotrophicum]|jgi:hypothetical protein|nr:hypothetical protein [Candidatus Methanoculleus thermohydrogenotrophicum]NLM82539.1 hypothetical protein [Candidatus Methanoculleus thermohydrogenotrophicum]HOB17408.1 hypothetical protein [Candidatus Methanoculleus thermohydrogenotrophicum]HPZ37604.1 hypothetical protein [Candidatus Methanoculleus thermohydrogenotrophicum]HQC90656.1 hypothetical protein [Candidatus Methanoculleus thermohydrogenotrophicum]